MYTMLQALDDRKFANSFMEYFLQDFLEHEMVLDVVCQVLVEQREKASIIKKKGGVILALNCWAADGSRGSTNHILEAGKDGKNWGSFICICVYPPPHRILECCFPLKKVGRDASPTTQLTFNVHIFDGYKDDHLMNLSKNQLMISVPQVKSQYLKI